jgi:hypothetical protein
MNSGALVDCVGHAYLLSCKAKRRFGE